MKILLTGASGFIGGHIQQALQAEGHDIVACSRQSGIDFNTMLSAEDWLPLLDGVDAVINAVGIIAESGKQRFDVLHRQAPVALFKACEQSGIQRVIQVSALGVDDQAFTPYQLSKKAADSYLRDTSLDYFILRPSLVYGAGGASMAMFKQLAALPIIPVVGNGEYQVQPVHISDLVASVLVCLHKDTPAQQTLDVVGAKPLSFIDWLQTIRATSGKGKALVMKSPFKLMLMIAAVGRYVAPMMSPENLKMLQAGNTSDVEPLKAFIGRMPLNPQEGLQL